MNTQADFRVSVKIRNANLLRAIERAGFTPGAKLAEASGVSYIQINDLLNMTVSPLTHKGQVRGYVDRLLMFLGVSFDEAFSDAQREALETNRSERDVSAEQVFAMMASDGVDDPLESLIAREQGGEIFNALASLTPRKRDVLSKRFGMGCREMTLQQIGDSLDLSAGRVRQIELKAIRDIRKQMMKSRVG